MGIAKNTILKYIISGLALMSFSSSAFAIQANTDLVLDKISQDGKNVVIAININNPSNQNISSVQSWLEFDKDKIDCKSINTDESAFDFVVPGESNISGNIIKIGRSSLSGDIADSRINVAKINCEIIKDGGEISFHDYQTDGGKVSVMVFENGFPVNTLKGKPESLKLETPKAVVPEAKVNPTEDVKLKVVSDYIDRPSGLKIDTIIGSAILSWDKVDGAKRYYIYYGKMSGTYLQRRLVPNNEIYKLNGLETGSQYYFAITAVGDGDLESDYSNEEAVIIGKKITSTSPLYKADITSVNENANFDIESTVNYNKHENVFNSNKTEKENYLNNKIENKKVSKNVQTGPSEIAIISLLISFIMGIFFYRRKYI